METWPLGMAELAGTCTSAADPRALINMNIVVSSPHRYPVAAADVMVGFDTTGRPVVVSDPASRLRQPPGALLRTLAARAWQNDETPGSGRTTAQRYVAPYGLDASSPTGELVTTILEGAAAPRPPVVTDESISAGVVPKATWSGLHANSATFPVEVGPSQLSADQSVGLVMAVLPRSEHRASEDQATADRAVVADHDRMAAALNDRVIQLIFSASLRLHGLYGSATVRQVAVLDTAVGELDKAIREIGTVLFEPRQERGEDLDNRPRSR
jgi:hypothetical protein